MFEKNVALPIFPTHIWLHQLAMDRAANLNQQLIGYLDDLMGPRPTLPRGENWQSAQTLHLYTEFADLVTLIRAAGTGVLDACAIKYEDFEITGCWANINPPGSSHPGHSHPNNFLSGVYYVQVPDKANIISFIEPRVQRHVIEPHIHLQNEFNQFIHNVRVQAGTLTVFPAWLAHSVMPNQSDELRISISFNLMLSNFAETISPPIWAGQELNRPPP